MAQCVVCSTEVRDDARFCPSCGAEQPRVTQTSPSDDPFIGQTVNRNFKIEKLLGVGGMGKVYKARQLSLDKAVVIKILHDHFRDDPQLVQRFQREARAASRLNHPNSIQVIDFGQDENKVLFMAQEFLEGVDLFTVLRNQGPLPKDRVARIMMQVCSALAEAHENNVIHRDLKPENIMVEDRRGQRDFVKVLDFGIAKIQDPDAGGQALTQAGMVCGTPEYMSPEQARGMQLDARSDLYSLGVLVYQLVTGELPFHADSPIGIVTKHILENPQPPRERAPHLDIDPELERIILRAMAKDMEQRYQTAAEMGEDFERLLYAGGAPSSPGLAAASTTGTQASASPTGAQQRAPTGAQAGAPTGAQAGAPTGAQAGAATGAGQPAAGGTASSAAVATSSSTSVQPATTTSPTPTGLGPQRAPNVVTHDDFDAVRPKSGGGAIKYAAIAVVALVVVGGIAAVALSGGGGDEKPDDTVATTDDGKQGGDTAQGDTAQGDTAQGDTAQPDDDTQGGDTAQPDDGKQPDSKQPDKGTQVAAATTKKPPKSDDSASDDRPTQKPPKVSKGNAAEAKALVQKHMAGVLSKDDATRTEAYEGLRKAFDLNPRDPTPLLPIAMYHRTNGHMDKSCAAIKRFISLKRKSLSKDQASSYMKQNCAAEDIPAELR